ncbi:MAG TPA: OmpA family protein, partial [Eudoraea sp.]|nr:OmpA family protein [Eudoraea sp.]
RETSKKTDQVLDSILEPGKKQKNPRGTVGSPPPQEGSPDPENDPPNVDGQTHTGSSPVSLSNDPRMMKVYSKFDFVPGDKLLFFDDFGQENVGDFPSRWNTNGSGEVVSINDETDKWFELKSGHSNYFIPDLPSLPEEYTIEFDLIANGLDRQTASTSVLKIIISDNNAFKLGNYALAQFSFCQYAPVGMRIRNRSGDINNEIGADLRDAVLTQPHISIAVNNQRFRLWMNEKKYIDVPRLLPADQQLTALKFELLYFRDGKERLFIKNLKVAEGGLDLRQKLIAEGRVSTNGILFDSGSANIQPQSMGIIRQISQALQQENNMNLNIIGHTDSDGENASNLELSKKRADAVKNALVTIYGIDSARLSTQGKGETEPIGDNNTADGKAQNRRVEFVKT